MTAKNPTPAPWLPEMPERLSRANDRPDYVIEANYDYQVRELVTRARAEITALREKLAKEKRSNRGLRKELKAARQELAAMAKEAS